MAYASIKFLLLLLLSTVTAYPGYKADPGCHETLRKRQYSGPVSVDGEHDFVAPGPSDLRGACPGLNSAANHGYISHNGYTTVTEATLGLNEAFGMSLDLANFLAVAAAIQAGDGYSFSIGGPPPLNLLTGTGLLGTPQGLSNSHNRFEGDASPTRCDLYQCGEAYLMHLPLFEQVYNSADSTGSITFDALSTLSNTRMDQSVSQNPYYFRAFVGAFIPPGTHAIMYRMLANHTGPTPDGILSQSTLKSFYSVAGTSSSNFVYTPGHERIPENWYKRAPGSEYSVPGFVADVVMIDAQHPQGASFGGNTGTVNSFVGLNVTDLTQGTYTAASLFQGNNIGCFLFQMTAAFAPDLVRNQGIIADVTGAARNMSAATAPLLSQLGCPQLAGYDAGGLNVFPGWTRSMGK